MKTVIAAFALAAGLLAGGRSAAPAADPVPPATVVSVSDLECAGCGKKLVAKLTEVPGVAKVEADVDAKVVKVTPKPGATPSPRQVWEAVEKAGKTPVKLQGPAGTFTAKPQA
jgi:copper chaperone CopZ